MRSLAFALSLLSAAFAFGAAVFWFLSVAKKLPPMGNYFDKTPEADPFYCAFKFTVRMNKLAALLAGLSALTLGTSLVVQAL